MSELEEKLHAFVVDLWDKKKISYNWNLDDEQMLLNLVQSALTASQEENKRYKDALEKIKNIGMDVEDDKTAAQLMTDASTSALNGGK